MYHFVSLSGDLVTRMRYVVFEFCSGSDLFNFLVTGPFEKMKRYIFDQCLVLFSFYSNPYIESTTILSDVHVLYIPVHVHVYTYIT